MSHLISVMDALAIPRSTPYEPPLPGNNWERYYRPRSPTYPKPPPAPPPSPSPPPPPIFPKPFEEFQDKVQSSFDQQSDELILLEKDDCKVENLDEEMEDFSSPALSETNDADMSNGETSDDEEPWNKQKIPLDLRTAKASMYKLPWLHPYMSLDLRQQKPVYAFH